MHIDAREAQTEERRVANEELARAEVQECEHWAHSLAADAEVIADELEKHMDIGTVVRIGSIFFHSLWHALLAGNAGTPLRRHQGLRAF